MKVWSLKKKKEIFTLCGHTNSVISVAISQNNELIFSGGDNKDNQIIAWDARKGEKLYMLQDKTIIGTWGLKITSDNKFFVTSGIEY